MEETKEEKRERLTRSILARAFAPDMNTPMGALGEVLGRKFNLPTTAELKYRGLRELDGREAFGYSEGQLDPKNNFGRGPIRENKVMRVLYNLQGSRIISDEENSLLCLEESNPVSDKDKSDFYDGCRYLESKLRNRTMTKKEYLTNFKDKYAACPNIFPRNFRCVPGIDEYVSLCDLMQKSWEQGRDSTPEIEAYTSLFANKTEYYASKIRRFLFEQNIKSYRTNRSKKDLTEEEWEDYKKEHLNPDKEDEKHESFSRLKDLFRELLSKIATK